MDRNRLEGWLQSGLSLTEIGELVGRDPSTVGYWCKKYGLEPNGRSAHAARGALTREQLEPLLTAGLSTREIAKRLDRSQSTVRHWLTRLGLITVRERRRAAPKPREITKRCRHHGETRFVLEGRNAYRCARCRSAAVTESRRRTKRALINARGGACEICGYDKHPAALHFHHLNPEEKAFAVSRKGATIAYARLEAEADKCVLLCANCHAAIEWGGASLQRRRDALGGPA